MAKARKSTARTARPVATKSAKCSCNAGWAIVALILGTIGLWGVVAGFTMQFGGAEAVQVLPWYFVGLLLIMLAKMSKHKCCGMCHVH